MPSYLTGLFENLMEGGEDAASTAMVVEGERRAGRGRDGRRTDTDRQTGQGSVQIQERGLQLQAGGASKPFSATEQKTTREETQAEAPALIRSFLRRLMPGSGGEQCSCRCSYRWNYFTSAVSIVGQLLYFLDYQAH